MVHNGLGGIQILMLTCVKTKKIKKDNFAQSRLLSQTDTFNIQGKYW